MKKTVLKDLAPMAIPHGPPEEACAEYFRSLMEERNMVKKYPVWDVARPTPAVLMEQARRDLMDADEKLALKRQEAARNRAVMDEKWRELREKEQMLKESFISFNKAVLMEQAHRDLMDADEKLELKRQEAARNRAVMDEKWRELRQKEQMLKESFISFNKFIRENQEKRDRAKRKMEADLVMLERKTRETDAMRARVEEMQEVKALMAQQVQDYAIYEDYLMSVVTAYPEFKQPLDVLNRYEALAAAKSALAERQERDLEMLENARQEIAALTEEKKLFIMGLNNTLANLRWRYDKVRNRVIKWELALNRLKETAAQRHVELCHVSEAIWSLYVKICKHKGLSIDVKKSDFEQQLVVIMRALIELRRIYRIAHKRSKDKEEEEDEE